MFAFYYHFKVYSLELGVWNHIQKAESAGEAKRLIRKQLKPYNIMAIFEV